jgi:SAM-dependent methyltransferase
VVNRPTPQYLAEFYAANPCGHGTGLSAERRDCALLIKTVTGLTSVRGRSLDVGAGDGAFSHALAEIGFQPTLIDHSPDISKYASGIRGSTFEVTGFEEFGDPGPFNLILMSQVLEHAVDPVAWLRKAATILAPGGTLAIALPNFGGIYRLLGRRDPFLCPPVHLNFFTRKSLERALSGVGIQLVTSRTLSDIATRSGFARSTFRVFWNSLVQPVADAFNSGVILWGFGTQAPARSAGPD